MGSGWLATAADGSYTVTGLPAGAEYQVYFYAPDATGGSSDSAGYVDQIWKNQPTSGTPTLVSVTAGATTSGIDAALSAAGTITGTVTDAAGQLLESAEVYYYSPTTGVSGAVWTAADGSYTFGGVPAGTDYQVCFNASWAIGGSSATGYVDQCWQNQPITGTPTPVTVTGGAPTAGIDAVMVAQ
jgi:hypothetical protein